MNLNNLEIRKAIENKRLKHYEVADALGVSLFTFSHWLMVELSPEKKERILKAIDDIK